MNIFYIDSGFGLMFLLARQNKRVDINLNFRIIGKLLERVLRKPSPRDVGVSFLRRVDHDATVIKLHDFTRHRAAIGK